MQFSGFYSGTDFSLCFQPLAPSLTYNKTGTTD